MARTGSARPSSWFVGIILPLLLLVVTAMAVAAPDQQQDLASGLIIDENWELVKAHCTVCHSAALVTQQRGSRETWTSLIRWMQNTQGLWQFDAETETNILNYLETNYAPSTAYRRAPLDPSLMPPLGSDPGQKTP